MGLDVDDPRRDDGFRRWVGALAQGEPFDWDPDSEEPEFLEWITSVYAGNGAMPVEWINPLVYAHRVELAGRALRSITRQAETDLGPLPGLELVTTPPDDQEPTGVVRAGGYGGRITGMSFAEVAVMVADNVQDWIGHDRNRIWPVCPEHGRGLHPVSEGGVPFWLCEAGRHVVSSIIQD
ncbi:hypothetical protein [Actinoplanes sp. DH11]|uniref:hypothetical protein n=1 Tax=Actinoplanes sp. DH11 TaxID=2857011 RepID=UPI001E631931|nr:hypothetical protein [Actinoplanes sp. DH11]